MARLQRVFIDTSELFPFTIMDVLLTLSEDFLFTWVWTDEVLDEWEEVIVREGQRTPQAGSRRRHQGPRTLLESEPSESTQVDRIVYGVCSQSTRRRPDRAFDVFAATNQQAVDLSDYLSLEDADVIIREQQSKLEAATEEARAATEDQDQLSRELSMKIGHLDRLHRALEERGIFDLFYETQHDPGSGIPDEADSVDVAILLAMDYLSDWLIIHNEAPQDLDGINSAPQATA